MWGDEMGKVTHWINFVLLCAAFTYPLQSVANSCIKNPKSVSAVIFDLSEPLSEVASLSVDSLILRIVDEVEEGGRLDVYVIRDGVKVTGSPLGRFCKPERPLAGGEVAFKRLMYTQFSGPSLSLLRRGKDTQSASEVSPVIESIYNVGLKSFPLTGSNEKKFWGKIIVISDLIQNSELASFYKRIPRYDDLNPSVEFVSWSRRMPRIGLELLMIPSSRHSSLQGRALFNFWMSYGAEQFCEVNLKPVSRAMDKWRPGDCQPK